MSNVLVNDASLTDIANAIRSKLSTSDTYKPGQMAGAIQSIPTGGGAVLGTKSIAANGTYNASSDGYDGYSQVDVNVPNTYTSADEGKVVSNGYLIAQFADTVTMNGTWDTTFINSLTVNVSGGGFASGTYTPASDALTATINTGLSTINGFIMWIPSTTTADSVRAIAFILIDVTNNFRATVGENNNHTQLWSSPFTGASRLQYSISGGDISMTTFDSNGSGYFVTEHTYQWIAW